MLINIMFDAFSKSGNRDKNSRRQGAQSKITSIFITLSGELHIYIRLSHYTRQTVEEVRKMVENMGFEVEEERSREINASIDK